MDELSICNLCVIVYSISHMCDKCCEYLLTEPMPGKSSLCQFCEFISVPELLHACASNMF